MSIHLQNFPLLQNDFDVVLNFNKKIKIFFFLDLMGLVVMRQFIARSNKNIETYINDQTKLLCHPQCNN